MNNTTITMPAKTNKNIKKAKSCTDQECYNYASINGVFPMIDRISFSEVVKRIKRMNPTINLEKL